MIESPVYQEIVEESRREGEIKARQQAIRDVLEARFGADAQALEVELKAVEFDRLRELIKFAAKCPDLPSFRERLLS
jgi:predicted transposase YdaD